MVFKKQMELWQSSKELLHVLIECFNLLYKSLVRTHLEYGVTTWFPYKMKNIETIEKIQKRATKQVKQTGMGSSRTVLEVEDPKSWPWPWPLTVPALALA